MNVRENFETITKEIAETCEKVGRNVDEVKLIAVTKYVTDARVEEAIEAGITDFAENRPQNYVERKNNYSNKTWHLIGSLQTRKVRDVINEVDYFHALDRDSLAREIEKRADKEIKCFVQVNVSGEESKHGLTSEEAIDFIKSLEQYSKIKVVGLMTMAPFVEDEDVLRNCFRKLRKLLVAFVKRENFFNEQVWLQVEVSDRVLQLAQMARKVPKTKRELNNVNAKALYLAYPQFLSKIDRWSR